MREMTITNSEAIKKAYLYYPTIVQRIPTLTEHLQHQLRHYGIHYLSMWKTKNHYWLLRKVSNRISSASFTNLHKRRWAELIFWSRRYTNVLYLFIIIWTSNWLLYGVKTNLLKKRQVAQNSAVWLIEKLKEIWEREWEHKTAALVAIHARI